MFEDFYVKPPQIQAEETKYGTDPPSLAHTLSKETKVKDTTMAEEDSDSELTSPSVAKAAKKTADGSPSKRTKKQRKYTLFGLRSPTADQIRDIFDKGLKGEDGGILPFGFTIAQFEELHPNLHLGDDDYYAYKGVKKRVQEIINGLKS